MAIYHLHVQMISRSAGRSAVRCAAYRSASKLYDEERESVADFTGKGGVEHSEITLPEHAPKEYANRQTLWNEVSAVENKPHSQLAREFEASLPIESSMETRVLIAREFAEKLAEDGMVVDWSIHNPVSKSTHKKQNPHVHLMATTRPIATDGSWELKTSAKRGYKLDKEGNRIPVIDKSTGKQKIGSNGSPVWKRETLKVEDRNPWDDHEKIHEWRKLWEDTVNRHLQPENHIDCRSYEVQGLDLKPTVHIGYSACQKDRELQMISHRHADIVMFNSAVKAQNEEIIRKTLKEKITDIKTQVEQKVGDTYDRIRNSDLVRRIRESIERIRSRESTIDRISGAAQRRKRTVNSDLARISGRFRVVPSEYDPKKYRVVVTGRNGKIKKTIKDGFSTNNAAHIWCREFSKIIWKLGYEIKKGASRGIGR